MAELYIFSAILWDSLKKPCKKEYIKNIGV